MSAVTYDGSKAVLDGNVFEDEVVGLREFIKSNCQDNTIYFDLQKCTDMHTAVVQLLLSSKATCSSCEFIIEDRSKPFAMALDGFIG